MEASRIYLEKYSESLYELVATRSEKIGRIIQSDVVLDSQEYDKMYQSAVVRSTARGPKIKKTLKDLKANGEEEGARSELEEEDAESAEGPSGNQTGISEKNAAANQKMTSDFEYDMFSDLAIGRGYDCIESNLELATPYPLHQFSQFLDRIQVSKITAGMIVLILSFTHQDPPTYDNLRPHIPAVYAAIPDARVGVTNMVLIHANQLFTDYECYPKCLTC